MNGVYSTLQSSQSIDNMIEYNGTDYLKCPIRIIGDCIVLFWGVLLFHLRQIFHLHSWQQQQQNNDFFVTI